MHQIAYELARMRHAELRAHAGHRRLAAAAGRGSATTGDRTRALSPLTQLAASARRRRLSWR